MAFVSSSDDLFDSIIMADDRFHDEGYQEGFVEGTRQGTIRGFFFFQVSFYYGFALAFKYLLQNSSDVQARKRLKAMESLIGLIQNFPYEDPQYEKLQEDMERARAKFRQVCSLLNVATDFKEYVSGSMGMSF
uniref:LTO1 maturation factor of ABCE1 n=1 Tax=Sinocyclocheilus anshuiensis TaxID=1608454 RepID=A0A671QE51_9TELE